MTQNKCSYSVFFRVLMERETGVENTSLGKIKALLSWWWIPQFWHLRRLILNLHYCASDFNFARLQNLSSELVLKIRSGMFTVWQRRDFFSLSFKRYIFFRLSLISKRLWPQIIIKIKTQNVKIKKKTCC